MNEKNVLCNGHVVCVNYFTMQKTDEVEEDGENVIMTIYGLLADYIAGDPNISELNT